MAVPLMLAACGSSAPRYTKQGPSEEDAITSMSECDYQIRLSKAPKSEQEELRNLCMQGKGYRAK